MRKNSNGFVSLCDYQRVVAENRKLQETNSLIRKQIDYLQCNRDEAERAVLREKVIDVLQKALPNTNFDVIKSVVSVMTLRELKCFLNSKEDDNG